MKFDRKSLLLYIVTDRMWLGKNNLCNQVEESILNGATFVQLREKNILFDEFVTLAKEMKEICKRHNVPFVINDNVDVALAVDADGVHIGQSDEALRCARERLGKDKIIGVSVQNAEDALFAKEGGADYLGVGAMFVTGTKKDASVVSMKKLKEITEKVKIPVVAIGGINEKNIQKFENEGIDGVAVISAIFAQKEIGEATRKIRVLAEGVFLKK